jgi:hypothetical protein
MHRSNVPFSPSGLPRSRHGRESHTDSWAEASRSAAILGTSPNFDLNGLAHATQEVLSIEWQASPRDSHAHPFHRHRRDGTEDSIG